LTRIVDRASQAEKVRAPDRNRMGRPDDEPGQSNRSTEGL
jgi:hypothetical protein